MEWRAWPPPYTVSGGQQEAGLHCTVSAVSQRPGPARVEDLGATVPRSPLGKNSDEMLIAHWMAFANVVLDSHKKVCMGLLIAF